ncbi:MAG: PIN domain-containing protein [Chloroflexota bacterium]|nr:PIN domain-containing protein [Chloroflexota bacterium]
MAIVVDTNVLFALVNASDEDHRRVVAFIESTDDVLILPVTVLPEIDYLITKNLDIRTELGLLRDVAAGGYRLEGVTSDDITRCVQLIDQYADSDIGLVDASIVAVAERLNITRILTLDHRHFSLIRPRHCAYFSLLP